MTALYGASQWTDLVKERNDVKASMGTKLFNYQVWSLISTIWFSKWKRYVNFEESDEGVLQVCKKLVCQVSILSCMQWNYI